MGMTDKLCRLTAPGGKGIVGDFCVPKGNFLKRGFNRLHVTIAHTFYYVLTSTPIHWDPENDRSPAHNVPAMLQAQGLTTKSIQYFNVANSPCYWTVVAQKPDLITS